MTVIRYDYVEAENPVRLSTQVEIWIEMGWQPFGSPYIWNKNICQSIVKYESSNTILKNLMP